MIHYELRCTAGHGFDGWFRDSAAFDRQVAASLVACPACGSAQVHRALMAPRIGKRGRVVDAEGRPEPVRPAAAVPAAPATPNAAPEAAAAGIPDQLRGMLQRLRAEVERSCENVGPNFAAEARAIHRGESKERAIYGDTTPAEAEALADEGVPVSRIPWVPRADG